MTITTVAGAIAATNLVTALATDPSNPTVWLFNLGTAGIWLGSLLTGWTVTKGEHQRVKDDLKESRAETVEARRETAAERTKNEGLRDEILNKTIPTLAGLAADLPKAARPDVDAAQVQNALDRLDAFLSRAERRQSP